MYQRRGSSQQDQQRAGERHPFDRLPAGGAEPPFDGVPAGRHTVEWRFRAPRWEAVEGVTLACSLLILLGAAAALIHCFRKKKETSHEG